MHCNIHQARQIEFSCNAKYFRGECKAKHAIFSRNVFAANFMYCIVKDLLFFYGVISQGVIPY